LKNHTQRDRPFHITHRTDLASRPVVPRRVHRCSFFRLRLRRRRRRSLLLLLPRLLRFAHLSPGATDRLLTRVANIGVATRCRRRGGGRVVVQRGVYPRTRTLSASHRRRRPPSLSVCVLRAFRSAAWRYGARGASLSLPRLYASYPPRPSEAARNGFFILHADIPAETHTERHCMCARVRVCGWRCFRTH